jgi:hypothetical protein
MALALSRRKWALLFMCTNTVTPIVQPAKYQVSWSNEGGRVWVRQGEVRIDGCEKKLNIPKDKIAELGRDCKLGAYLRPKSSVWYATGLAAPAAPPIICYYLLKKTKAVREKRQVAHEAPAGPS